MADSRIYFLDQSNRRLQPMVSTDYSDEAQLQTWLADYPDLIPGDQIAPDAPRRWLLVKREMGVPDTENATGDRWSLDHLFLDQDGVPTFVEVKRAVDTRIRREVIGQMLDYAANGLAYWSLDRLRQAAAETAQSRGKHLDDALAEILDDADENAVEAYWQEVGENLRAGRVRLLFAVDKAPPELRRLTEFLNERLKDVEVLIVELKQYTGEMGTAIAPLVIGATEASRERKPPKKRTRPLTLAEFNAACPTELVPVFADLISLANECGYHITWNPASFSVRIHHPIAETAQTLFIAWIGSWDVAVYFEAVDMIDPLTGRRLRDRIARSGVFPFTSPKSASTAKPLLIDDAGRILQVVHETLLEARALFEAYEADHKLPPR